MLSQMKAPVQILAEMIHYRIIKTAQFAVTRRLAEAAAGTGIKIT